MGGQTAYAVEGSEGRWIVPPCELYCAISLPEERQSHIRLPVYTTAELLLCNSPRSLQHSV